MITKITIQKQLATLNELLSQLEDGLADKSNALDNAQDSNNEDRIDKLQHECDTIEEGISELESLIAILEDYEQ